MFRIPFTLASPAGPRGRLSILILHRVLPQPDALFPDLPDAARFEAQLRWLRDWFEVLPLHDGIERLYAGRIPARALAISFDDGYADNEQVAAPILRRLGLSATFFVTTSFLSGGCMWNDRVIEAVRSSCCDVLNLDPLGLGRHVLGPIPQRRATIDRLLDAIKRLEPSRRAAHVDAIVAAAGAAGIPSLMMTPGQLHSLRRMGMDVGAHTLTHPILSRLSLEQARAEIGGSKEALERLLGEPVRLFAYPNGVPAEDYGPEHAALVRDCGFDAAVSTAWGAASAQSDRYQLPRFTPWDRSRLRYGARMLANLRLRERIAA
jgi:peptidoglycan/xylan/chitin deacetylase (PgdA/CDA1 family)